MRNDASAHAQFSGNDSHTIDVQSIFFKYQDADECSGDIVRQPVGAKRLDDGSCGHRCAQSGMRLVYVSLRDHHAWVLREHMHPRDGILQICQYAIVAWYVVWKFWCGVGHL